MQIIHFSLPAVPPFRLDLTVWALRRRSRNRLDLWDGNLYTRVFIIHNIPVKVEIKQKKREARIFVVAKALRHIPDLKFELSKILNKVLGLQIDLKWFYDLTKKNKDLHPLINKFRGLKPPRFPNIFETLTNAICNQQLSLEAGLTILNNLIENFGKPFPEKKSVQRAFPTPDRIRKCTKNELMALGFSRNKSEALISLASMIFKDDKQFDDLEQLSNEEVVAFLCSLKGIGRWSSEYTLLRGLGRTEILPGDDVAIHKNIAHLLKLRKRPDYNGIKKIEKKWHSYAGLIYFHLLLNKLSVDGII